MKSTTKTLKALTYLALCILWVNCDSEVSPTSPSPVSPNQAIRADNNPIHDIDAGAPVAQSSHIPPLGDFPPLPAPGDLVDNTDFVARRFFQNELNVFGHSRLRLEAINGEIKLMGDADENQIIITGERMVGSKSMEDANQHLKELEVRVMDLGNEILLKTIQPENSFGRNYTVNYTISLPRSLEVSVNSLNGYVELRNIAASAMVRLLNGRIDGDIFLPRGGTADLSTMNGDVALNIPADTSAEFLASVTNGTINLSDLVLRNEARDRFSVRGTLGDGSGRIELRTTNGRITTTGF